MSKLAQKIQDGGDEYGTMSSNEIRLLMELPHEKQLTRLSDIDSVVNCNLDEWRPFQYVLSMPREQLIRDIQNLRVVPLMETLLLHYGTPFYSVDKASTLLADALLRDPTHNLEDRTYQPSPV
jgi:hypothetical protein